MNLKRLILGQAEETWQLSCFDSCLGHLRRQTKKRIMMTSHLCDHRHKVGGGGLVVQSLPRLDSQDTTVPIDGKLWER